LRFRDLAKRSTCHVQRSHEITRANRQGTAIRFRVFDRPKRWPSHRPRRRTGATRSRIVEEISRLAFSNAADVFSIEGGQLVAKEHAHLDHDTLSTIASVEESVNERGHRTTKVRQHEPLPPSHCWRGSRACRSIVNKSADPAEALSRSIIRWTTARALGAGLMRSRTACSRRR
jgi:hypothetical protein